MHLHILVTLSSGEVVDREFTDVVTYHVVAEQHELTPSWYKGVVKHLSAGNLVLAVKLYREVTGASLRDSHRTVTELRTTLVARGDIPRSIGDLVRNLP